MFPLCLTTFFIASRALFTNGATGRVAVPPILPVSSALLHGDPWIQSSAPKPVSLYACHAPCTTPIFVVFPAMFAETQYSNAVSNVFGK